MGDARNLLVGNRTAPHLKPGQHDLREKKTATICRCCDKMINHKEKIISRIHGDEIKYNTFPKEAD